MDMSDTADTAFSECLVELNDASSNYQKIPYSNTFSEIRHLYKICTEW